MSTQEQRNRIRRIRGVLTEANVDGGLNAYDAIALIVGWLPYGDKVVDAIDKIVGNPDIKRRLEGFQASIDRANDRIATLENDVERFNTTSATVVNNGDLQKEFAGLLDRVVAFIGSARLIDIDTRDFSAQSVVGSMLSAEEIRVSASNHSQNIIEGSILRAEVTLLHASGGSTNNFRDTVIGGLEKSVVFDGVTQTGNHSVKNSGIGFGDGSILSFGGAWAMGTDGSINLTCPKKNCNHSFCASRMSLLNLRELRCPQCGAVSSLDGLP